MLLMPALRYVLPVVLNTCAGNWIRADCDERNPQPRPEQSAHHPRWNGVSECGRGGRSDLVQPVHLSQLPRLSSARCWIAGTPVDFTTRCAEISHYKDGQNVIRRDWCLYPPARVVIFERGCLTKGAYTAWCKMCLVTLVWRQTFSHAQHHRPLAGNQIMLNR